MYLTEEATSDGKMKLYYNEAHKLSAMVYQQELPGEFAYRMDLYYDANNRLDEVRTNSNNPDEQESRYKFWYTGDQVVGIRRNLTTGNMDSLAIQYDAAGRIARRDYFDYLGYYEGQPISRLYSAYTVEYNSDKQMTVSFFSRNFNEGVLEPSFVTIYTMDGAKRPYPDEYYLLYLAWTNVVPSSNIVQQRYTDPDGIPRVSNTGYSYNISRYPTSERYNGNVAISYAYSCEAPVE